jgi:hypothetical protein
LELFKDGIGSPNDEYHTNDQNAGFEHIEEMMKRPQAFFIEIGDYENRPELKFLYTDNDPIFNLASENDMAAPEQKRSCNCCECLYKNNKDAKYCDFCALAFCAKCRNKTRAFPKCSELNSGNICKVCDRKFFIRELIKEKQVEICMKKN